MPVSSTSVRYQRALDSLQASALRLSPSADPPSSVSADNRAAGLSQGETVSSFIINNLSLTLTDWLVNQWLMNTPFATASLYLDIISSLYGSAVKGGHLPKTDIFSRLKVELKTLGADGWKMGIDDEIFTRALRLTKNAANLISDDAIAADLILWSLTHALQPLEEIAMMKRDYLMGGGHSDRRAEGLCAQIPATSGLSSGEVDSVVSQDLRLKTEDLTILNNLSLTNARRKYVFPLCQSQRTPAQLKRHVAKIVNALFKRARLPQATDPYQTVEALWAYAALRIGIPAGTLVAHLGHAPLGLPVLKLSVVSCQLSEPIGRVAGLSQGETSSFKEVGRVFLENPPRWYAMSLRPGVRFTQVCRRIQLLSSAHSASQPLSVSLFYPCEEIARAIGKKIVIKKRPFIHSVVFFRAKITDIGRLFAKIGDLAWCYRQSARPGAPYADISPKQFELFQQTIASFTPDYEVASIGDLELKKNDRVQILGGLFAGHEAIMEGAVNVGTHGSCVREPSDDRAAGLSSGEKQNANPSGVVYRLNIIGDNGIEWRIALDRRLLKQK